MKLFCLSILAVSIATAQSFVPADFPVPTSYAGKGFTLVPLGLALTQQDYEAYMSSVEHLQKTFGGGRWPTKDITMEDAKKDMAGEEARAKERKSFTYAAVTPDGKRELGCVYISPSRKAGYDAMVRMWVTKEQFDKGFEDELLATAKKFVAEKWPFGKVAYLGKDISQADFRALPDKSTLDKK